MEDNGGYLPFPKGFATAAIHAGQNPEKWDSLSVTAPIVLSATFKQLSPGNPQKYKYARSGNPTREVLEECLAKLEGAKYGLCFASAMGAATTLSGLLQSGDHVICGDNLYPGTMTIFNNVIVRFGITTSFIDATDTTNIENAITANTKLIWVETPTNPLSKVVDIKATAQLAKKHKVLLLVDNTFLTPYLQRPLELGADLSLYSATKYLNGHTDVTMGVILLNNTEVYQKLRFLQNAMGVVPSPFDCSQVNRSLKTLAIRMRQHSHNAMVIAKFLASHPKVIEVRHPGLPTHPQHELFKKQTSGPSGIFSFYLKGDIEESKKFIAALKVFTLAHSLGGTESLVALPSRMSHLYVTEEQQKTMKITGNLIRLAVGLEEVDDLVEDLKQALEVI